MRVTVDGRSGAILHYPGAEVHPLALRSVMLGFPEVLDYQAAETVHGVSVNVLLECPADLRVLAAWLETALERAGLAGTQVEVQGVASLPRHPETGKLRCAVPPERREVASRRLQELANGPRRLRRLCRRLS
jgi:phenylacetate-coenzyme A ligase PaaK-like adenylate-forming protein